jgi:hypothetical protein
MAANPWVGGVLLGMSDHTVCRVRLGKANGLLTRRLLFCWV